MAQPVRRLPLTLSLAALLAVALASPAGAATTDAATEVDAFSAVLNGTVNPAGQATSYRFEYGTTTSYGSQAPASAKGIGSGTGAVSVEEEIEALEPGTTYHFRLAATNPEGTTYGADETFRTKMGGEFVADEHPAILRGTPGTEGKLTLYGTEASCVSPGFETWQPELGEMFMTGGAAGASCYGGTRPVKLNGCEFELEPGPEVSEGTFEGTLSIGPASCGPIETKVLSDCEVSLDPHSGFVATAEYTNEGEGSEATIEVAARLEGLEYTSSSCGGPYSNGAWDHDWEIWAGDEAEEQIGVRVVEASPLKPKATTKPPTGIGPQEATFHAVVNPRGISETTYQFEYGTVNSGSGAFDLSAPASAEAIGYENERIEVDQEVEGLVSGETYRYRVAATNGEGTTYGRAETFTTPNKKPITTTEGASGITATAAALSGTINPNGYATSYQFAYGKTTGVQSKVPASPKGIGSGSATVQVEESIDGLQENTLYYYRLSATNALGTTHGQIKTFKTADLRPIVATGPASETMTSGATLNAMVNPNGSATTYQFEFGPTTSYGSKAPATAMGIGSGDQEIAVSEQLEGLDPEAIYHYRAVATNDSGTTYGDDMVFSASSTKFYTGESPAVVRGVSDLKFVESHLIMGSVQNCKPPPFQVEPSGGALEVLTTDGKANGSCGSQPVNMNGCRPVFAPGEEMEEGTFGGTFEFGPAGCGPITVDKWGWCGKAEIDPHTGVTVGVKYTNVPEGPHTHVAFEATLTNLSYSLQSCANGNGSWNPRWEVRAENEGEEPIPLWVGEGDPDTVITDGPSGNLEQKLGLPVVSFSFAGGTPYGQTTFECALNDGGFSPCTSPISYPGLAEGVEHKFRVQARDSNSEVDPTPAERSFKIIERPETTITSPRPSYTAGDKSPITFVSDDPGATFECRLDGEAFAACTSPYALPAKLSADWHTFQVRATDEFGNLELWWPPVWTFNRAIYPAAPETSTLISPEEGRKSASHFTLRSKWSSSPSGGGVSSVGYQLKHPSWDAFKAIPSEYLRDAEGKEPGWAIPVSNNPGTSPPLFFDVGAYAENEEWAPNVDDLKLRAVFNGGKNAAGASEPVTVSYSRFGGGSADATAGVGPANVNLLTGAFTMSRTDVSIPVPGTETNLEFTRTYNSAYGAFEATNSKTLGQMWQPSAPVESEYEEEAWQKLVVKHEPAVPAVFEKECWDEEGETIPCGAGCNPEFCEEWMAEEAIPEANWVEVLDNEGAGIPFDQVGSAYVAPEDAKEFKLTKPSSTSFLLVDANGTRTEFTKNGSTSEYRPTKVSFKGTEKAARLVYEVFSGGKMRLDMIIAPSAAGVTCDESPESPNYAPKTAGCRSLHFFYAWWLCDPSELRLWLIGYDDARPSEDMVFPAGYAYDEQCRLDRAWDPRVTKPPIERYSYDSGSSDSKLTEVKPPGEEPWEFDYYSSGEQEYEARLKSVSRASLLENGPSEATTTIVYDVPVSGEGAPYDMSPASIAEWAQTDFPVDATAIFPPDQVPSDPPSDYTRAAVHYMDPDGNQVNTASTAPPGVEGKAITTSEVDAKGNVVRELSAHNRLQALAAGPQSAARAKELDSHSTYNGDGTRMLESFGPLHEVRLENGQTVKARQHTTISYDQGAPTPKEDEVWPNLPTKELSGARIPGQGSDKDVRVSETKYDWDLRKPTEQITDPSGLNLRTKTVYNAAGQVVESRQPSDIAGEDAGTTVNAYYSAGTQSPITACRNKPAWAGLPCVSYPKAEPSPAEANPKLPWTWITSYNTLDTPTEIQEKVDGELKRTTTTTYDAAGRPVKSHKTGQGVETPPSETVYDPETGGPIAQRLVCAEECEGFDNQEVKTTFDTLGRPTKYEDADGNVAETEYDLLGRVVTTSDLKGGQIATYDANSGVLTQMTDSAAGTFTASYDADGKMLAATLPNGLVAQPTYNTAGSPTALAYEQTYCSKDCTWLEFERQSSIHGEVLWQQSKIEGELASQAYAYDKASRLTLVKDTEAGQCTTRAYSFDANTNRTKLITRDPGEGGACDTESAGTTQDYSYDSADRLLGEGVKYDTLGRITELPSQFSGGGKLETTYYVDDLTRSQTQDGITNTYELDSTGRQRMRIRTKGEEESTEIYHYASDSDSPAWIDEGETWTRNIEGIGGDLAAIEDSATGTTLQLPDLHGDVVATASLDPEAMGLLESFGFDEFGNPKSETVPKYGWLGKKQRRTELPSGVIQMGVRSYVPGMGRFLSVDPVKGGSANTYDYAYQDPVNVFDLDGRCPWCVIVGGAFARWATTRFGSSAASSYIVARTAATRTSNPLAGRVSGYTRHGLTQAMGRDGGRGVTSKAIASAVRNPSSSWCRRGSRGVTTVYQNRHARVVVNSRGRIVTAFARSRHGIRNKRKHNRR